MNAAGRLSLYGAGLVAAFAGAFGVASVVVPDSLVASWEEDAPSMDDHAGTESSAASATEETNGVTLAAGGYVLSPVTAPTTVGAEGTLSFQVLDLDGEPLVEYTTAHDKDLHLIVVRTDGAAFHHVHPELDSETGTWSVPITWDAAGTYRMYADFVPEGAEDGVTITRTVEVAGDFTPAVATGERVTDTVDGFEVTIDGDLTAGEMTDLTVSISRDGEPVTTLEPYLGAFGHLVALREGDLAYLHVHAEGDEPEAGDTAGPEIGFMAEAPTAGRYLLYLDFQVDGEVHTAQFVLDAGHGDGTTDTEDMGDH